MVVVMVGVHICGWLLVVAVGGCCGHLLPWVGRRCEQSLSFVMCSSCFKFWLWLWVIVVGIHLCSCSWVVIGCHHRWFLQVVVTIHCCYVLVVVRAIIVVCCIYCWGWWFGEKKPCHRLWQWHHICTPTWDHMYVSCVYDLISNPEFSPIPWNSTRHCMDFVEFSQNPVGLNMDLLDIIIKVPFQCYSVHSPA